MKEAGALEALKADLQRRCGNFADAHASVEDGMRVASEELIKKILIFEGTLISKEDRAVHTVSDAIVSGAVTPVGMQGERAREIEVEAASKAAQSGARSNLPPHQPSTPNSAIEAKALEEWGSWQWAHAIPVAVFAALFAAFLNLDDSWAFAGNIRIALIIAMAVLVPIPIGFVTKFVFDGLAVITVKTSTPSRPFIHLLAAVAIAALVPMLNDGPLDFLLASFLYFDTHPHFIYKLAAWGMLLGFVLFRIGKQSSFRPFPAFPLRWYVYLVAISLVLSAISRGREDASVQYWYLSFEAHYVGLVTASYVAFWAVTWRFQTPGGSVSV